MLKSHEKFHSANGKRLVLIADDELINREMLRSVLEEEYELLFAENGQEAQKIILENRAILSLVLLDLMMPVMSGTELLQELKADPELRSIPVIVITSDQQAEVECLTLGVSDFIPKPYPQADIIRARILHTIELSEDRQIINSTERDPLTGLYNREFFYSYAEQFDQHHQDMAMDAIVVDVNHFHMINERFGTTYGDGVLRRIGEHVREMVQDTGGIVCRREADTFMVYCPHGKDYGAILEEASIGLAGDDAVESRVRLRLGVYENVDKTMAIERRFDRAQMAADTVRGSFTRPIGLYDEALHQKELYAEQLIEEFPAAIRDKQFHVYYQPKFDIRPETPVLASAEALVRWMHPELGMILPGVFIPLFEENGLIQMLDDYVWREAAADIRRWKDHFGFAVPVSVNMSRIDMYDPKLVDVLREIVEENGLTAEDLHLEITESAYAQDSDQIIRTVNTLRELGFRIEMDDFGTGYSSLNMISDLPIDVLKLDMQFVRNAFKQNRDTRMLEVIIDIASYINVPVIAEGVETEDQLIALRELGCDQVQGYYFSKPVPASEYEVFLTARKAQMEAEASAAPEETDGERDLLPKRKEEPAPEMPEETGEENVRGGIPLRVASYVFAILAFIAAIALFISDTRIKNGNEFIEQASETYMAAKSAAMELEAGSDYLTESIRMFVVTGELQYLEDYFEEANETRQRDNALAMLESLLDGNSSEAYTSLMTALNYSNELMGREYYAMRLVAEANRYDGAAIPDVVASLALSEEDLALTAEEQRDKAQSLVFDEEYVDYKDRIREQADLCTDQMIGSSREAMEYASESMNNLLEVHTGLVVLLLVIVLLMTGFISAQIRKPLTKMVEQMSMQKSIPLSGASELRFVIKTYNRILKENQSTHRQLTYEASHDPLTGLYNRSAYEMFMQSTDGEHIALLLVDVDEFKGINDRYGHDVGDQVLKKVSSLLKESFRSVDIICRIGGDEFVVIMTRVNSSMAQMVQNKIAHANRLLQNPEDGLPKISLSVGVAFSDRENPQGDIFKDADSALYRVKEAGRCGCAVF